MITPLQIPVWRTDKSDFIGWCGMQSNWSYRQKTRDVVQ